MANFPHWQVTEIYKARVENDLMNGVLRRLVVSSFARLTIVTEFGST